MRKSIVVTLLALLVGLGMALEVPDPSEVTATDGSGAVVGVGEFEEGSLELVLSEEAAGFLTLTFSPEEGDAVTVEVMVSDEGELLLADTLTSLVDEIEAAGGTAELTTVPVDEFAEEGEGAEGNGQHGLDVADAAAGENGAHGRAKARAAQDGNGKPEFAGDEEAEEAEEEEQEEEEEEELPEEGEEGAGHITTQPTTP